MDIVLVGLWQSSWRLSARVNELIVVAGEKEREDHLDFKFRNFHT